PAAAADAAPPDDAVGVRGEHPQVARHPEAAWRAHRLGVDPGQGARAGVSPPERQGQAGLTFTADTFRPQVTASDADISAYFEAHKTDLKIPEKRKIRYLLVDIDALRAKVVVPPADIERTYNNNIEQYSTPEQVRASHV